MEGMTHDPEASRGALMPSIPTMDRLLRPAVNVLIGHGASPIEHDLEACLEEMFPEKDWRLHVYDAATSHDIFSIVRSDRIHLVILLLNSIHCESLRKSVIGPASALGMVRVLRSSWNLPLIAIDESFVDSGLGAEALGAGADCFLRWPCEVRRIRDEITSMTGLFYAHRGLDAVETPEHVLQQLRNWNGLAAAAFECFRRYGRVVIGIEQEVGDPFGAKLTALTCNPFGGWPDPKILRAVLSYDPEIEILIRFADNTGRERTERVRTGPAGNIPKKAHKIGLLSNTLDAIKIERKMAPFG